MDPLSLTLSLRVRRGHIMEDALRQIRGCGPQVGGWVFKGISSAQLNSDPVRRRGAITIVLPGGCPAAVHCVEPSGLEDHSSRPVSRLC
jgi:hypothetical protein